MIKTIAHAQTTSRISAKVELISEKRHDGDLVVIYRASARRGNARLVALGSSFPAAVRKLRQRVEKYYSLHEATAISNRLQDFRGDG